MPTKTLSDAPEGLLLSPSVADAFPLVRVPAALWVLGGFLFVVAATANGAGYRYGASDQAFYIPVVLRALDPAAFPRDASLIDAQGRLMLVDEVLAAVVRATNLPLDLLFFAAYVASLLLVWIGVVLIGTRVYQNPWATAALAAAVTLRHRIPRTSANSLEPYFHPRLLAFGLGVLAIAALLRRRAWLAIALIGIASVVHITTAMWFAVLVGVALAVLDPMFRRVAFAGSAVAAVVLTWMVAAGPLADAWVTMDQIWLQAVASKDSLFATEWPVWAWAANLALLAIAWWTHTIRARRGEATREDEALIWGATALVALFLLTLPLVAARFSLAVQFQISRVFWLVDFVAVVYAIGALAGSRAHVRRRAMIVAGVAVAFALVRGTYVMLVERPDRALVAIGLEQSAWNEAMEWIAARQPGSHVLADPGHAWKFGTSVRVAAERDVFLEDVKDSALAIYSRDVAVRFVERVTAIGDFQQLTPERATTLAGRYHLDYLVTEADLPLALAYSNERFRVYSLR